MRKTFQVTTSFTLFAECILLNRDLLVNVTGGEIPHVGGIVTFDYQLGQENIIHFSSHDGRKHQDILLAERLAKILEDNAFGNLVVNAGVHIDGITKQQIDDSFVMVDKLGRQIQKWLFQQKSTIQNPKYTTHLKRDDNGNLTSIPKGTGN